MDINKEKFAFELFLELYDKLPPGIKTECPDFIINQNSTKIGVELIELMEDVKRNKISSRKIFYSR